MAEILGRVGDGLRLLVRRWWFVLGFGLVAAALGFLWATTVAAEDGEATARVGFGPDPEYFDILPNIDRITSYVESDEFRTALGADAGVEVVVDPPNGILAFLDLKATGAADDTSASDTANDGAALVVDHMNMIFGAVDDDVRETIAEQLVEIDAELPILQAKHDELVDVLAANLATRSEDDAAFETYAKAENERSQTRIAIEGLVRKRAEAQGDLDDLDRARSDATFEVLRSAEPGESSEDAPIWPLAGGAGLVLGALTVLARDRDLLPVRETADLDSLRVSEDVLLVDGSLRSVALLLRRKAELGERVLVAGFGLPTGEIVERLAGLLNTLERPSRTVLPTDTSAVSEEVTLVDGGQIGSSLAEEAVGVDSSVFIIGSGRAQSTDLDGPVGELSALGVDLYAIAVLDTASAVSKR